MGIEIFLPKNVYGFRVSPPSALGAIGGRDEVTFFAVDVGTGFRLADACVETKGVGCVDRLRSSLGGGCCWSTVAEGPLEEMVDSDPVRYCRRLLILSCSMTPFEDLGLAFSTLEILWGAEDA